MIDYLYFIVIVCVLLFSRAYVDYIDTGAHILNNAGLPYSLNGSNRYDLQHHTYSPSYKVIEHSGFEMRGVLSGSDYNDRFNSLRRTN